MRKRDCAFLTYKLAMLLPSGRIKKKVVGNDTEAPKGGPL